MPRKDKEARQAYYAEWYAKHREEKIAKVGAYQKGDRRKRSDYERSRHHRKRQEVFDHYGNKCECCGETEPMFLTVDHINGGGKKHGKKVGNMYVWLASTGYPEGFRLLCMNCNFGRERNGGVCPHKE